MKPNITLKLEKFVFSILPSGKTFSILISKMSRTLAVPANSPVPVAKITKKPSAKFQINKAKLYVLFVTLFINDNIKFLENTKQGFKRTISWNKYISYITTQPKNNSLGNLIGPAFRKINRFFVLSFKNGDNDPTADSFDKYYMSLVEIKDLNALISNKPFFDSKKASKKQTRSV